MTGPAAGPPNGTNGLRAAVERRRERRDHWHREGERTLWRGLAWAGALGWLIVVPALIGVAAGRWLDRSQGTGVFWTGALIMLGIAVGCRLAWRRMHSDD